jgi:hypothetical protein
VAATAALFEQAQPWAVGSARRGTEPESGRFRVTVGRGVIRLGWSNPVRKEKAAQRTVERHDVDVDSWQIRVKGLLEGASRLDAPAEVAVTQRGSGGISPGRTGRQVTEWSRKSRSAMCRTFAELDYTPLVESGRVPAMVTLTYPGDWETVAPDGVSVKRHMVSWRKRFTANTANRRVTPGSWNFSVEEPHTFTCGWHRRWGRVAQAAASVNGSPTNNGPLFATQLAKAIHAGRVPERACRRKLGRLFS